MNPRADFTVMFVQAEETNHGITKFHRFLCIVDLDAGGVSVTNDIERILAALKVRGILKPDMRVIYRDSEELWDEVIIDDACEFVTFRALREPSRERAMAKVIVMVGGKLNG